MVTGAVGKSVKDGDFAGVGDVARLGGLSWLLPFSNAYDQLVIPAIEKKGQ